MNALYGPVPRYLPAGVVCPEAAAWWAAPEGCGDEDCYAADECEDLAHGARPPAPGACTGVAAPA